MYFAFYTLRLTTWIHSATLMLRTLLTSVGACGGNRILEREKGWLWKTPHRKKMGDKSGCEEEIKKDAKMRGKQGFLPHWERGGSFCPRSISIVCFVSLSLQLQFSLFFFISSFFMSSLNLFSFFIHWFLLYKEVVWNFIYQCFSDERLWSPAWYRELYFLICSRFGELILSLRPLFIWSITHEHYY